MTREEAITYLNVIWNRYKAEYEIERETLDAYHMAIEALSADAVSREEYEELYRKAKEVNEMANDILADFPSYKELLSAANLKEEFESAVPNCKKCAIKELWKETEKEDLVSVVRCKDCRHRDLFSCPLADNDFQKDDDFCSWGERRK